MDTVRYHPKPLLERLLDWAEAQSTTEPEAVTAIALAYVYGLNEHQIAATCVLSAEPPTVAYPAARRASAIRKGDGDWMAIELCATDWIRRAAERVTTDAASGELLYSPLGRIRVPVPAATIRKLVRDAAAAATGVVMSVSTLVSSRTVAVQEAGTPLALHGLGHAPSWAARLTLARPALILPRKAR